MNIENISSLSSMLSAAGFDNLSYRLLQHICCQPVQFSLHQDIVFGSDYLNCQIYFEKIGDAYSVRYYDATLLKELRMPPLTINQVGLQELEATMHGIDWQLSEMPTSFRMADESTWEREKCIERVVHELARLSGSAEGKKFADALKVRFWSGSLLEQLNGSLAAVRSKLSVSQRFYFMAGEIISVSEAWRFLKNRWMERKLLALRKSTATCAENDQAAGKGKELKLLKKKRLSRVRGPINSAR